MKNSGEVKYLTESRMGEIFNILLPNEEFCCDKQVPNSKSKKRPDYRFENRKLIIEFDGDGHYCNAKRIIEDKEKDTIYKEMGYRVVRIPYFVQMNTALLDYIFKEGHALSFTQEYSHGFIDKKAKLPADFCELGLKRFIADLNQFSFFQNEILESLRTKKEELGNINLVLPPSLQYLLDKLY